MVRIPIWPTCEKVASELGLGGGFRRVLRFPPLLTTGKSRISHNWHNCYKNKIPNSKFQCDHFVPYIFQILPPSSISFRLRTHLVYPFWITNIKCTGKESKLSECDFNNNYNSRCISSRNMDAGLLCYRTQKGKIWPDSSFLFIQCWHLIPALNAWAARAWYTTVCPIATKFPGHGCMDDLWTERSLDLPTTWVIDVLDISFDVIHYTRHWKMYGRLMQELSVCTVDWNNTISICIRISIQIPHQWLRVDSRMMLDVTPKYDVT